MFLDAIVGFIDPHTANNLLLSEIHGNPCRGGVGGPSGFGVAIEGVFRSVIRILVEINIRGGGFDFLTRSFQLPVSAVAHNGKSSGMVAGGRSASSLPQLTLGFGPITRRRMPPEMICS